MQICNNRENIQISRMKSRIVHNFPLNTYMTGLMQGVGAGLWSYWQNSREFRHEGLLRTLVKEAGNPKAGLSLFHLSLSPEPCLTSIFLNESLKPDVFSIGKMKALPEAFYRKCWNESQLMQWKEQALRLRRGRSEIENNQQPQVHGQGG